MGNIVHGSATEDGIKPERTILTVRAVGAFKTNVSRAKQKSAAEQIDEIIEWKFRRKNTVSRLHPGRLAQVDKQEETDSDDPEKEVLKFVHRYEFFLFEKTKHKY